MLNRYYVFGILSLVLIFTIFLNKPSSLIKKNNINEKELSAIKYFSKHYSNEMNRFKIEEEKIILQNSIVFFGDSITTNGDFINYFPKKLIVNRGIGSDVLYGMFKRVDEVN